MSPRGKDPCLCLVKKIRLLSQSPTSLSKKMQEPAYWWELSATTESSPIQQEQPKRANKARFHHICPIPDCLFDCVRRDYYIKHLAQQHGIVNGINTTTIHYCRWFASHLPLHNPGYVRVLGVHTTATILTIIIITWTANMIQRSHVEGICVQPARPSPPVCPPC